MRVLYDHQKFSTQRVGGITRYFAELFAHFSSGVTPVVSLKFNRNLYISGHGELFPRKVYDYDFTHAGRSVVTAAADRVNRMYSEHDLRHLDYDIFHPTYYGCYFMKERVGRPVVVTVHDMIQEVYPDAFGRKIIEDKKRQIFTADHIVAVSQHTKNDILRFYPEIAPDRISVIRHGWSLGRTAPSSDSWPDEYLLFVGKRDGYKNFLPFVKAVAPLMESRRELRIICTGEAFKPYEVRELASLSYGDRVLRVGATDAQLMSLYVHAGALVFPSLYEGFGLPILEAFGAGCPVCLSDASCFPEIAEDAAVYFDPSDPESICAAVSRCFCDEGLRKTLKDRGYRRLKAFDWSRSAAALEKVYADLL